jgi:hypothetical protein
MYRLLFLDKYILRNRRRTMDSSSLPNAVCMQHTYIRTHVLCMAGISGLVVPSLFSIVCLMYR